jgi:hypothetical protein
MSTGRVPGPLGIVSRSGIVLAAPGPLGRPHAGGHSGNAGLRGPSTRNAGLPGPSATRLLGLTVTHGARRAAPHAKKWESYLFEGDSVIVLAKTDPDTWSTWSRIRWHCSGGKPVTGYGNGWRIPRSEIREYRVSASSVASVTS